jgi:hypothetical protein
MAPDHRMTGPGTFQGTDDQSTAKYKGLSGAASAVEQTEACSGAQHGEGIQLGLAVFEKLHGSYLSSFFFE